MLTPAYPETLTPASYINTTLHTLEGWCTTAKAERLVLLVEAHKPRTIVEIGVFAGRSLFALAIAQRAHVSNGITIGIDPWSTAASTAGFSDANKEWWEACDHEKLFTLTRDVMQRLGLCQQCCILRATAADALPFASRLAPIDMLHIDGNHSAESALFDVASYVPLVRAGGIVLLDDIDWETTKPAQLLLTSLCKPIDTVGTCGVFERLALAEKSTT